MTDSAASSADDFSMFDEWGPEKVICVSDTRTGMRGVLVIDNTARGMGKGGTRMSTTLTVREVARLARVMTWKWAALDLFFGGAKAGVLGDPHGADKEAILRAFVRKLAPHVPAEYVLGLDIGLTERDAVIVQEELADHGAAVGTPRELGGVPYDEWGVTGHGVAAAVRAAVDYRGLNLRGARVVVQGVGAVGAAAILRLDEMGATLVGASTASGSVSAPEGIDVAELLAAREAVGDACIKMVTGTPIALGSEMALDADILVLAATQDVAGATEAAAMTASIVVEGANLPLTPPAQLLLAERNVTVVPDFIANAGGTVAAAWAMDARYSPFPAEPAVILRMVDERISTNSTLTIERAADAEITTHEAARELAQARVRAAMELRCRLPEGHTRMAAA